MPEVLHAAGHAMITGGDEEKLKKDVAKFGPVAIGVDATDPLMDYKSGIFFDESCNSQDPNHKVLVVGYGTAAKSDYWIVKISLDRNGVRAVTSG